MTDARADLTAVFDLDGTLLTYESFEPVVAGPFREVCGRYEDAWGEHNTERFFEYFGALATEPFRRAYADTCEEFGLDADPQTLTAVRIECECSLATVPDGVRETLDELTAAGHSLAVCSNGVRRVQRAKLAAHDLLAPFETVVTSYDVGAHKPATEPFEAVRRAVGAGRYVMVGDSDDDVEGARAAGMAALGVADGFPDAESILAATR